MDEHSAIETRLRRLLGRIRGLAEEVRQTAERAHKETEEAHRLAGIVRTELGKSRALSRFGRDEMRQVHGSIGRSLETAHDRGIPVKEEGP